MKALSSLGNLALDLKLVVSWLWSSRQAAEEFLMGLETDFPDLRLKVVEILV